MLRTVAQRRLYATESSAARRIVAASVVSRAPLTLPAMTPFENEYYSYQRSIHRALNHSLDTTLEWFLQKGSTAEKSLRESDKVDDAVTSFANEAVDKDVKNIERLQDRTLYLLVKKNRKEHAWQFPQGGVEKGESLVEAATRELLEETGENLDTWAIGSVPAACYSYEFPQDSQRDGKTGATVFFMPFRALRGLPELNKAEGLVDYAWLSKEEIQKTVSEGLWDHVHASLSDR